MVSRKTGARVQLAYLEFMRPALAQALDALAEEGVVAIRIVPVFLAAGGHVKDDLPRFVQDVKERHPGLQIDIDSAIGEQDSVLDAIAGVIAGK